MCPAPREILIAGTTGHLPISRGAGHTTTALRGILVIWYSDIAWSGALKRGFATAFVMESVGRRVRRRISIMTMASARVMPGAAG